MSVTNHDGTSDAQIGLWTKNRFSLKWLKGVCTGCIFQANGQIQASGGPVGPQKWSRAHFQLLGHYFLSLLGVHWVKVGPIWPLGSFLPKLSLFFALGYKGKYGLEVGWVFLGLGYCSGAWKNPPGDVLGDPRRFSGKKFLAPRTPLISPCREPLCKSRIFTKMGL